jgi:hypothetical protein
MGFFVLLKMQISKHLIEDLEVLLCLIACTHEKICLRQR